MIYKFKVGDIVIHKLFKYKVIIVGHYHISDSNPWGSAAYMIDLVDSFDELEDFQFFDTAWEYDLVIFSDLSVALYT